MEWNGNASGSVANGNASGSVANGNASGSVANEVLAFVKNRHQKCFCFFRCHSLIWVRMNIP